MAGSWRVALEAVQDLDNPKYRVGDLARLMRAEDMKIKNVVFELGPAGKSDAAVQVTKPFHVDETGCANIDQVVFVQKPSRGNPVLIRAVKPHRLQKDALIGEAEVFQPRGRQRLELKRSGKARGVVHVNVTDGIPAHPSQSSGGAASPGKKAIKNGSRERTNGAAAGKQAGQASQPSPVDGLSSYLGCFECLSCVAGLLGSSGSSQRKFLEKKRAEPGVMRRPSGLLYRVLRAGHGRRHPAEDSACDCHYRGCLVSGREFDSSYRDGRPASFEPREVIKGWCEALQLMVEGDQWELYIPPELGYGERGVDGVIPGGATLVFQVELVKIPSR